MMHLSTSFLVILLHMTEHHFIHKKGLEFLVIGLLLIETLLLVGIRRGIDLLSDLCQFLSDLLKCLYRIFFLVRFLFNLRVLIGAYFIEFHFDVINNLLESLTLSLFANWLLRDIFAQIIQFRRIFIISRAFLIILLLFSLFLMWVSILKI